MTTIIKAADRNRAIQPVAFNLDDVRGNAEQYLTGIRQQAAHLLAEARREADAIRQRAAVEGQQAAEAAVERKLDARMQGVLATLAPALDQTLEELRQLRGAWLARWEHDAVHLACAIAARVIRRELRSDPHIPLELVREALALAAGSQRVRVRLSPQDHAALGAQAAQLAAEIARLAQAEVIADAGIEPGGCRVETEQGAIDQQFAAQLARIEEELS